MTDIKEKIWEISDNVKKQQFQLISETYGYDDLYDFDENGEAMFHTNPYEEDVWGILESLSAIDGITHIEVDFAEDKDEDYDIIKVNWRK